LLIQKQKFSGWSLRGGRKRRRKSLKEPEKRFRSGTAIQLPTVNAALRLLYRSLSCVCR